MSETFKYLNMRFIIPNILQNHDSFPQPSYKGLFNVEQLFSNEGYNRDEEQDITYHVKSTGENENKLWVLQAEIVYKWNTIFIDVGEIEYFSDDLPTEIPPTYEEWVELQSLVQIQAQ